MQWQLIGLAAFALVSCSSSPDWGRLEAQGNDIGLYSAFILASRPDVAVLERLRQLEEASKPTGTLT